MAVCKVEPAVKRLFVKRLHLAGTGGTDAGGGDRHGAAPGPLAWGKQFVKRLFEKRKAAVYEMLSGCL